MYKKTLLSTFSVIAGIVMHLSPKCFAANVQPMATDSRIKTLVYNPGEVYQLTFIVGYQSLIEFAPGEAIQFFVFGESSPWSITALQGNTHTLILKAIDPDARTNFIVQTDQRKYIFDISSVVVSEEEDINSQLTYLVRFFYPEIEVDDIELYSANAPSLDTDLPVDMQSQIESSGDFYSKSINYKYLYAGTGDRILPISVFDDGARTFFKFPANNSLVPAIFAFDQKSGRERRLKARVAAEYIVIDAIEDQFVLRYDDDLICIFNQSI